MSDTFYISFLFKSFNVLFNFNKIYEHQSFYVLCHKYIR